MDANPYKPPDESDQQCGSVNDQERQVFNLLLLHAIGIGYGLRSLLVPSGSGINATLICTLCMNVLCVIRLRMIMKRTRQR